MLNKMLNKTLNKNKKKFMFHCTKCKKILNNENIIFKHDKKYCSKCSIRCTKCINFCSIDSCVCIHCRCELCNNISIESNNENMESTLVF